MNKLVLNFALLAALSAGLSAHAQKKKEVINDSNTPLHLLQPDYQVGYGIVSAEDIKKDIDRVLRYLESNTPTRVVDKRNGKVITDYANMDTNAQLERGTFRLASYEWGVTYSAMLAAAGMGIAMANGSANAKAAADRTGPDAEPHGVADLCRELWPEAF